MRYFAYLDPATGSLFIQIVIGGFFAVSVALRSYIKTMFDKIKLAFARQTVRGEED